MKMKITKCVIAFIILSVMGNGSWAKEVKFAVISDPHLYDNALGISGEAFEKYLASDRKMMRESGAILESALDSILNEDVDFLIVSGDLTKDGELACHQKFAEYMKMMEEHGLEVFVIPGNHDINNSHAVSFAGETTKPVPSVSPEEFSEIYGDFGYNQALDRDPNSLSYVAEPLEGLWIIAIDSCRYEDSERLGYPVTAGRISPETQSWVIEKLEVAKAENKTIFGVMHHGIVEHFSGQSDFFSQYVVEDWENISETFADAGLKMVFTGHFHAQDSSAKTWTKGDKVISITDVETGSLVNYPSPYRIVTLKDNGILEIRSDFVMQIEYDTGNLSFPEYSKNYIYKDILENVIEALVLPIEQGGFGLPPEVVEVIAPKIADGAIAHFAGDELPSPEVQKLIEEYIYSGDFMLAFLGFALKTIYADLPPADNDLTLNLNPYYIDIYSNKSIYGLGDTIEIGVKVFNPTDEPLDVYVILMYDGKNYYYPMWKKAPDFVEIAAGIFEEKILEMVVSSSIPAGEYFFHAAILKKDSAGILGLDRVRLDIR